MPDLGGLLKSEISRIARKVNRSESAVTRRLTAQHRRDIAELKRQVQDFSRRLAFLEAQEKRRPLKATVPEEAAGNVRFSPKWLKVHRQKLGLSAADYARLVGVSALTIYNWEGGKSKPRPQQMVSIAAVRGLGKREALRRLELMGK